MGDSNQFSDLEAPKPISLTFGGEVKEEKEPVKKDDGSVSILEAEKAVTGGSLTTPTLVFGEKAAQETEAAQAAQHSAGSQSAASQSAAVAAAVQQAPAQPFAKTQQEAASPMVDVTLTPEEQKQIDEFAKQIDLHDSNGILTYGAGTQKKMSQFTDTALENVRNKDVGEVGDMIASLVGELKDFDVEEDDNGFLRLFKRQANKALVLKEKYDKAENSVDQIVQVLENHQVQLLKDIAMLDKMYDLNLNYFKELSMYIIAGKKRLAEVRNGELKELQEKAAQTGLAQDAQAAKDLAALCDRFEKKIYDLELTRQICIQTGPQIRLLQDSDTIMAEKIQSTIVNTIPLWKNQMVIALGVEHSNEAAKAQREVTELTNNLLKKNAETLKTATVETAKESERGVVDIETLRQTNQTLMNTLDEVLKIQDEGRAKRASAEAEMQQMEAQMKEKLLEISKRGMQ